MLTFGMRFKNEAIALRFVNDLISVNGIRKSKRLFSAREMDRGGAGGGGDFRAPAVREIKYFPPYNNDISQKNAPAAR